MRLISLTTAIFLLLSCSNSKSRPDVSGIAADVRVQRFDQDFFAIDTTQTEASLDKLYQKYPSFLPIYFEFFSPINFIVQRQGRPYSDAIPEYYRNLRSLYDSVQKRFGDFTPYEKELEQALRYAKHYFPSTRIPAVFTTVESLNPENKDEIYGALFFRDTLVISLQMFLGKDFPAYDPSQYFDYLRRRFEPQYIVANSMRAVSTGIYPDSSSEATLIEQMIEKGKQWYLLDHFLPDTPDSIKTFFTQRQLDWCRANEGNIWAEVLKNTPDLYVMDKERIQNYLGESPFTPDLPHEASPGNIGQWIGWQIVKEFAEKNGSLSLEQVVKTPAKKIFQEAKYRPK
ncbi:MAG TPA: hypothetical protein VFR58_16850 [Flavisolibacter sp.]|nr:hypothetical protein [Flavisolibacter sp.]